MINLDNLIKEIEDYKAVVITGNPELLFLLEKSAEEIAKEYTKADLKPLAELLGVKTSNKEITVIKNIQKVYNSLF